MKKYILFQFNQFHPAGGLADVTGSFDTLQQAKDKVARMTPTDWYDYNYVVDRDTWTRVWGDDCP